MNPAMPVAFAPQINAHFSGKFEVELKYRLLDRDAFFAVLQTRNPEVMLEDNLEHDCYFDLASHSLISEHKSLCIREMQPSGIMLWIVKGPEKDRCEAVNITDATKAKSMLHTLGYECVLEIKKRRSIYFLGKFHLTLDNLDGLGDFAELAIMTDDEALLPEFEAQLLQLATELGLCEAQRELLSYRQLSQALKTNGLKK
ncbi:class IV adenylate cyclase [Shewanella glacialipiscicola]|uniref:Adenylate cyclase n=1 Tax=Shewanella glacialipiscicola TaxID=614069 RepID=A0ABQ6J091_9GAMM|nr:class IV adenylate cyclase [Shewanella glacialipiscicola]MCL1086101.1 class IV adenylate cyclase [Shewanella glacialipiscicola]MCU7993649.1 class IV adenylate cyclase [Shewanella glacialipiscicola]MCU8024967.1 class IV adenylate cyclase [Shewanella glacialipiscicola]GIU05080.1 adenylate cyclase [Shewanella glacialipiscicola]GMA80868.1 adenylate cyclase [Shewanella glacialipiscicola]